jgi:arginine exporter protein ArgO
MGTAVISLLAAACCIAGGFLTNYSKTLSRSASFVGIGLAVYLAAFHLTSYVKNKKRRAGASEPHEAE